MYKKDDEFSDAEKLDYVFKKLRSQERRAYVLGGIKLAIFIGIIYFYLVLLPRLDIDKMIQAYVVPQVSKIVSMTVQNSMNDMSGSLLDGENKEAALSKTAPVPARKRNATKVNITPEMVDAVKQEMQKQQ